MLWIYGMTVMLLVQGRGEIAVLLKLLQYCYITVLWIHELTEILLIQIIGDMLVLPEVTAVLLRHKVIDIWTDTKDVIRG
jgi:hypothetical protein